MWILDAESSSTVVLAGDCDGERGADGSAPGQNQETWGPDGMLISGPGEGPLLAEMQFVLPLLRRFDPRSPNCEEPGAPSVWAKGVILRALHGKGAPDSPGDIE